MGDDESGLLLDATVLIDFHAVDADVLTLAVDGMGPVIVLTSTLEMVDGMNARRCRSLGLQVEEPSAEELQEAAPRRPGLALDDRLCIEAAIRRGLTCVTNDRKMRSVIQERGGTCLWSLALLLRLVRSGHLAEVRARRIAHTTSESNPGFIGESVVADFEAKLDALE